MLLGCIADDLTGATDLALMLTRAGMRTLQIMDVPGPATPLEGYDAVVVALKTRTCPVEEAVRLSLASADALLARGARQLFFKYCSTFDSTDRGNIGPVADALLERVGGDLAIACPAFPTNKRTVYLGNLFVGEVPLAESPMKDHPLTPMRDSSLVRVLQRQTRGKVGLVPFSVVEKGPRAIADAFSAARSRGERYVIVDAITDKHLVDMGAAAAKMALITGGSGVALGLPANFIAAGLMTSKSAPTTMKAPAGRALIVAGSCSEATRGQVKAAKAAGIPAFEVDPLGLHEGRTMCADIVRWAKSQPADRPVLVYSSADPASVKSVQEKLGREAAGALVERELATVARALVGDGFSRIVVAGGETSGAVVNGLGVTALEIGPEIDPGVPWTTSRGSSVPLALALKSGNFGGPEFFTSAWAKLS
ncbi:MAG TPA: four-carbon acid sugar kinase family protein [Hyphomicrobiaceae bacterium]|nr:four-carbon acid sugar kinase family protein [Hyphomicrobiaceae bacterium]